MKTVGIITTGLTGLLALGGAVLVVRSLPDLQRYLRIRSM
ncbi:MAG: hypothetical protein QOI54_2974 [Actinomycetota bacterium]|jgi:hypothetical protein|nr:hypothetical protein [Actinomycetota bacterium]